MSSIEDLRNERLKKKRAIEEKGFNPYPAQTHRTGTIELFLDRFSLYEGGKDTITLAGRVMSMRGQGGLTFVDLFDGTAKTQLVFKLDEMDAELYQFFTNTVDVGDFIEATGTAYTTARGAQSLFISGWSMLTKSLRPIPDSWYGLRDDDERYRKRYLDILQNPELQELFKKKAKFWQATRNFLVAEGFLEVETPTIEVTTGGAEARPFKTHHNDFDLDVFMRISVGELWQKRLLAAGFPRTFEIGRIYRNEGSSPEHLQEFTSMEFYAAYMDYRQGIEFTERMIQSIVQETFETLSFTTRGHSFDLSGEWPRITYVETVKEKTGIDVLSASEEEIKQKIEELGVAYEGTNRERLTDTLWKYCRKQIAGPVWLIDVPKIVSPLSKAKPENPELTERVQLIVAGSECTNGFSELNDPVDQAERFAIQKKLVEAGDEEAMMPDDEFVEMLEYGMPPAFGFGMGERFFAFLANKPIRETQLFPLSKPRELAQKSKETKIAVAVLNREAKMPLWQEFNTVAHLNAAFGARVGKGELFTQDVISSKDNIGIKLNTKQAILIKQVDRNAQKNLKNLVKEAINLGLEVDEFTREMIETTNDKKIIDITKQKNYDEVEHLGVLIYGPKDEVESITKIFELYS